MPRNLLFAPCQIALVDGATTGLSIVNIIESVGVRTFPAVMQDVSIVTMWRRHEDEAESQMVQKITLEDPDHRVVLSAETPFIFERIGHRTINRLSITFPGPGPYELCLYITRAGADFPEHPVTRFPIVVQQAPTLQVA